MRRSRGSVGGMMSLVDTLFLLLFTLLAVSETRSSTNAEEVLVALPEVASDDGGNGAVRQRRIAIVVDESSTVRVEDGAELEGLDDLDRALAAATGDALPEEVTVEIRADADARHGVTVVLLQHLRLAGFADVRLTAVGVEDGGEL